MNKEKIEVLRKNCKKATKMLAEAQNNLAETLEKEPEEVLEDNMFNEDCCFEIFQVKERLGCL